MEASFTKLNQELIKSIRFPILVTDAEGNTYAASRMWETVRPLSEQYSEAFEKTFRDARVSRSERSFYGQDFVLYVRPLGDDGRLFCHQVTVLDDRQDMLLNELIREETVNASYREKLASFNPNQYIATSDHMVRVFMNARVIAEHQTSVMILGERGVGKKVLASFIHHHSDRQDRPFIKIDCAEIPEPLIESEMFGFETDAVPGTEYKGKAGLFELANSGTVLLDEIGELSIPMQKRLLEVIQSNEMMRIGGHEAISLDIRIISTSSRNLEMMMKEGRFLPDLFYRLNVVEIVVPPLRERKEDIDPLAEYYLQLYCEKYETVHVLSQDAREFLQQYEWAGNVRELRNAMDNLAASARDTEIAVEDLPIGRTCSGENKQAASPALEKTTMKEAVEKVQKEMIIRVHKDARSLRKTAAELDMDPATLQRLVKKLGIDKTLKKK